MLTDIFHRFEHVGRRFDAYASLPPRDRLPRAISELQTTPRSGWLRVNPELSFRDVLSTHGRTYNGPRVLIEERAHKGCESIAEHLIECEELYIKLFFHAPHRTLGQEVCKFHDVGEPAFADFTPHDKISPEEKERLEQIAINLLTEARRSGDLYALHTYNCFTIFDRLVTSFAPLQHEMLEQIAKNRANGSIRPAQERFVRILEGIYTEPISDTDLAALQCRTKDIDRLQMAYRAHRIWTEGLYTVPTEEARQKLDEFWDWIATRLKTEECKGDFTRLRTIDDRFGG